MKYSSLITILILPLTLGAQSISDEIKNDQFDFWVGEWDVNLRVKQPDNSWKDQHRAIARIYPAMEGKAILELWEEQGRQGGILGYSLRYYDEDLAKWVLWLNWPGPNRSGSTCLTGEFRHGRGEFFGERQINDSTTRISKYTFSDINESSLRWDDAYSTDGGKNWTHNWIMEFSRRKEKAPPLVFEAGNHTNSVIDRCGLEQFDLIKELTNQGMFESKKGTLERFGVLEGCSVISTFKTKEYAEVSILTFNTYAQVYEELVFDRDKGKAEIYYGRMDGDTLRLDNFAKGLKRQLINGNSTFQLESYEHGELKMNLNFGKK